MVNVDKGYVHSVADFEFTPGIFELLSDAKVQGFLLLLVTNQSGIARGYYSAQDFWALSTHMQALLQTNLGFGLDRIYHCPHAPEACCECRKPKLGMLAQALRDFSIDTAQSVMVGDKRSDMEFGLRGGIGVNLWLAPQELMSHPRLFCIEHLDQARAYLKSKSLI